MSMTVKIAVLAPMPRASAATAVIVKLGLCRKMRSECMRSFRKDSIGWRLPVSSIKDADQTISEPATFLVALIQALKTSRACCLHHDYGGGHIKDARKIVEDDRARMLRTA